MITQKFKKLIKSILPGPLKTLISKIIDRFKDIRSLTFFFFKNNAGLSFTRRLNFVKRMFLVSLNIECEHTQKEMNQVIDSILNELKHVDGIIVEAGAYKGGSSAKISIAAKMVNRKFVIFDSFEGIPENCEQSMLNGLPDLPRGMYCGMLDEVKGNVGRFGEIEVCEFIKGWFEDTMPKFSAPIAAIFLDVDLASSTRTCLKCLYPLLAPGGILYSHDGHIPVVRNVYSDDKFWKKEVGCQKPYIDGLGKQRLIKIIKPIIN